MELAYPITSELLTLDCATFQRFERELRNRFGLSILQYRVMSFMQQGGRIEETHIINIFRVNASQLSKDLSRLFKRGIASWKPSSGSSKTWSLTRQGLILLEDADGAVEEVYDRFFSGLEYGLEEVAMPGLVMISQSHGVVRIKGERFFDEQTFFESILPFVQIITNSSQTFGLSSTQFRILFELLEHGPALKARLAKELMLYRSTVNWACEGLEKLGFICITAGSTGRARPISLTYSGRKTSETLAEIIDRAFCDVRIWSPEEKRVYQHIAEYFVKTFAK